MSSELSPKEGKLLDSMEFHTSVKESALAIGMDPDAASQYLWRIRQKKKKAMKLLNRLREKERKSPLINKSLVVTD
jgi:hypothetical protein